MFVEKDWEKRGNVCWIRLRIYQEEKQMCQRWPLPMGSWVHSKSLTLIDLIWKYQYTIDAAYNDQSLGFSNI